MSFNGIHIRNETNEPVEVTVVGVEDHLKDFENVPQVIRPGHIIHFFHHSAKSINQEVDVEYIQLDFLHSKQTVLINAQTAQFDYGAYLQNGHYDDYHWVIGPEGFYPMKKQRFYKTYGKHLGQAPKQNL